MMFRVRAPVQMVFSSRGQTLILPLFSPHSALKALRPSLRLFSNSSSTQDMSQQSASTSAAAGKAVPPIPRPSASLVIVNHRNEVLLVQRNPKATAFGGFHVFPGGNYDKKQDKLLAITAIRETFEESGLLLASSSSPAPPESTLDEARFAIHQQQMLLKPDVDSLLPFMKWITPVGPPKRFETQFFVTFLPQTSAIAPSNFSSGEKQERLPTPDGGQEFYILSTLSGVLRGTQNTKEQRSMVKELSNGDFGRMVINPVAKGQDEQGRTILTYEGDELRGGMPGEITLIRNFDIFTEIEPAALASAARAKL
ncbi:hypothetical protein BKA70DRAFT_1352377 [Coprinopsis sp. MPI-PUGE-AT-0042]|nr:hypothetical protein BKA70DRAFT_1352377 [Coprinopsis sp. MPI-PUGE-AT-0042]